MGNECPLYMDSGLDYLELVLSSTRHGQPGSITGGNVASVINAGGNLRRPLPRRTTSSSAKG